MPHKPIPPAQPPGDHAEELLAVLAHELRRPLTALLGAVATLQQRGQALPALQQQELLGMAHRQGEQLRRLLDQVLEAAGLDRGHAHLARRSLVDAAALAQEAGQAARLSHPDHPVTIEAAGPLLVRVDPLAVSRILGNLLDNAATYSPKGAPIRLSARRDRPARAAGRRGPRARDPRGRPRPGLPAVRAARSPHRQRWSWAWARVVRRPAAGPRQPWRAPGCQPARPPRCPLRAAATAGPRAPGAGASGPTRRRVGAGAGLGGVGRDGVIGWAFAAVPGRSRAVQPPSPCDSPFDRRGIVPNGLTRQRRGHRPCQRAGCRHAGGCDRSCQSSRPEAAPISSRLASSTPP
jgi:hypothetical protein